LLIEEIQLLLWAALGWCTGLVVGFAIDKLLRRPYGKYFYGDVLAGTAGGLFVVLITHSPLTSGVLARASIVHPDALPQVVAFLAKNRFFGDMLGACAVTLMFRLAAGLLSWSGRGGAGTDELKNRRTEELPKLVVRRDSES